MLKPIRKLFVILLLILPIGFQAWGSQYFNPALILEAPNSGGVSIAVIDSGLDANKGNLPKSQIITGVSLIQGNVSTDNLGHGSVVAAIIADPNVGGNSKIKVMPIKVFNDDESASSDSIAEAIDYASKKNMKVISISLGGPENSPTLTGSVQAAISKGSIVVASSGNEGNDVPLYPASILGVVSVGGIGKDFKPWSLSNRSSNLTFVAMSQGIDYYGADTDGTSFAAPEVSRILAQLIFNNPKSTSAQILTAARNSALDLDTPGKDDRTGYGLIDFQGADLILKGNNPTKTTLAESYENLNGKLIVKSILRTSNGQPAPNVTIKHYAYLQNYRKNVFLGSSITDSTGNSTFQVNVFGNGTLWSRSIAQPAFLASASQPLDFTGLAGLMTFKAGTDRIVVTNSVGEPVVGYELPLWLARSNNWVSFDQEITDYNGEVMLSRNIVSDMVSFGATPDQSLNIKKFKSSVIVKPILYTIAKSPFVLIKVTDKSANPVTGLIIKNAGREYITDNQGQIKIEGKSVNISYADPVSQATKTLKFAPYYKPVTNNSGQWGIKVSYPSRAINGKAVIGASISNSDGTSSVMSVELQVLNNGVWRTVSTLKSSAQGNVNFSRILNAPVETFRVSARTPSGILITNSFDIPRA